MLYTWTFSIGLCRGCIFSLLQEERLEAASRNIAATAPVVVPEEVSGDAPGDADHSAKDSNSGLE